MLQNPKATTAQQLPGDNALTPRQYAQKNGNEKAYQKYYPGKIMDTAYTPGKQSNNPNLKGLAKQGTTILNLINSALKDPRYTAKDKNQYVGALLYNFGQGVLTQYKGSAASLQFAEMMMYQMSQQAQEQGFDPAQFSLHPTPVSEASKRAQLQKIVSSKKLLVQTTNKILWARHPELHQHSIQKGQKALASEWKTIRDGLRALPTLMDKYGPTFEKVAKDKGIPTAAIAAITMQETSGGPFNHPRLERAHYNELKAVQDGTNHVFKSAPFITTATLKGLSDKQLREYATSYGMGQIMGWQTAKGGPLNGVASLKQLVGADIKHQIEYMGDFIVSSKNTKMLSDINTQNWSAFASRYNGSGWKTKNPNYARNVGIYYDLYNTFN